MLIFGVKHDILTKISFLRLKSGKLIFRPETNFMWKIAMSSTSKNLKWPIQKKNFLPDFRDINFNSKKKYFLQVKKCKIWVIWDTFSGGIFWAWVHLFWITETQYIDKNTLGHLETQFFSEKILDQLNNCCPFSRVLCNKIWILKFFELNRHDLLNNLKSWL